MPLVVERRRFFVGLMGLRVNREFAYPGYFAMIPAGPDPNTALTEGFFAAAAGAIASANDGGARDAEFAGNPLTGGPANAERYGFTIVHDRPIR